MKKRLAVGMLMLAIAGGCSNAKKTTESSVTEPLAPAPVAYQPAPQPYTPSPVAAQPVTYDSAPTPVVASAAAGERHRRRKLYRQERRYPLQHRQEPLRQRQGIHQDHRCQPRPEPTDAQGGPDHHDPVRL